MFTTCTFRTQSALRSQAINLQKRHTRKCRVASRRALLEQSSVALLPSTPVSASDLTSNDPAAVLRDVDFGKAKEGLEVFELYAGQAAGAAGAAIQGLFSPFQVFGDSVFLSFMFFGTVGLLAYSLLILAPRQ